MEPLGYALFVFDGLPPQSNLRQLWAARRRPLDLRLYFHGMPLSSCRVPARKIWID